MLACNVYIIDNYKCSENNIRYGCVLISKAFESDVLAILTCMSRHGYVSLEHIAEETGISAFDVRRYLLQDCWEKRPAAKMEEWREKNFPLYAKLVQDCTYLGDGIVRINTSKREYLDKYSIQHGFIIHKTDSYPFVHIEKRPPGFGGEFIEYDASVSNYVHWNPLKK